MSSSVDRYVPDKAPGTVAKLVASHNLVMVQPSKLRKSIGMYSLMLAVAAHHTRAFLYSGGAVVIYCGIIT